ncbi:hypothetical protein ACIQUY_39135 [Streptomyces sp. NPDC090231]|uniref:hypothetical protein n=1 Tax=unclassified Streptomyces TaxID=2593676 RepID=UPI002E0DD508|nr:hypothetical protein OG384_36910 [Streptomyces sp. NBC_01324]
MTATEAAAALEEVRLQQHLDRDREDLAADERGPAEVGEWQRIGQLLATTGGTYDPASDAVVQDELAAETAAAEELAAAEQARQEQEAFDARARKRSHVLAALEEAGLLDEQEAERLGSNGPLIVCEPEDLAACDHINDRGDWRLAAILEGRDLRPPKDPDALPASVRAHSALLTAMARNGSVSLVDAGHAVRLAQADPAAVLALAAWIEGRSR